MTTDRPTTTAHFSWQKIVGGTVALGLVGLTLWLAGISEVSSLITGVTAPAMAAAVLAAAGSVICRGLRLGLLLPPGALGPKRATPVAAVAQAAALFVPARVGELALPWLLHREHGSDGASGVATLLAARTLDTAALGVWTVIAILVRSGLSSPLALGAGILLVLTLILVPAAVSTIDRYLDAKALAWGELGKRWADRVHRVRQGLDAARSRPWRLAGAAAACIASWAFQWTLAWWLLAAMGYRWPPWNVVTGSAVASLSNLLPFNLVANIGTLEAGWTAAFTALGVPIETAAATGLATHMWALIIAAAFGAIGWLGLRDRQDKKTQRR